MIFVEDNIRIQFWNREGTVFPELVSTHENGIKAINYIALIPVTIQAIKEQDVKIELLEKQIAALNELVKKLTK